MGSAGRCAAGSSRCVARGAITPLPDAPDLRRVRLSHLSEVGASRRRSRTRPVSAAKGAGYTTRTLQAPAGTLAHRLKRPPGGRDAMPRPRGAARLPHRPGRARRPGRGEVREADQQSCSSRCVPFPPPGPSTPIPKACSELDDTVERDVMASADAQTGDKPGRFPTASIASTTSSGAT